MGFTFTNTIRRNDEDFDFRDISTAPLTEVITLDEVKNYLGIPLSNTADDAVLTDTIVNARTIAEGFLNRDIIGRERELFYPYLNQDVKLLKAPIDTSVPIVVLLDGEVNTGFEVLGLNDPTIRLDGRTSENVTIRYTTLSLTAEKVKNGLLALTGHLYPRSDIKMPWEMYLTPYKELFI